MFSSSRTKCGKCGETAYPIESIKVSHMFFHRPCFKCSVCRNTLSVSTYFLYKEVLYCKMHVPKATATSVPDSVVMKQALRAPKLEPVGPKNTKGNSSHQLTKSQSPSEFEKTPKAIKPRRFDIFYTPEPVRHKVPAVSTDRAERKSYTPHLVTPVKSSTPIKRKNNFSIPPPQFDSVEDEKPIEFFEPKRGKIGVLQTCKLVTFSAPPSSSPQSDTPQTPKKHQQQYHKEKEDDDKKFITPEKVEIDFVPSPPPQFVKGPMEIEKPSEFIEPEIRNTGAFHTFEQVMFSYV